VLDRDSSASETFGRKGGPARNGRFGNPDICSYLENECHDYAFRLRSNEILNREIEHLMTRPVGRPPRAPVILYHEFMYQAAARDRQRRVIAKVEWHRGHRPMVCEDNELQGKSRLHGFSSFSRLARELSNGTSRLRNGERITSPPPGAPVLARSRDRSADRLNAVELLRIAEGGRVWREGPASGSAEKVLALFGHKEIDRTQSLSRLRHPLYTKSSSGASTSMWRKSA
jgi:hypothetical protein